jgi:uncharacterized membrane protein YccC
VRPVGVAVNHHSPMSFVHDAGSLNLRRGLRAGVVVPALYAAAGAAIGPTAALYGAFASFAALVFADFQGTPRRRLEGYATLAGLGTGLVLLGSFAAELPVAPAVAIFVVTFAIRYAGCLGGYAIAAGTTLMLAFALAVMSTPVSEIDQRVVGWLLGCAVAAGASMVAPVLPRSIARERLAAHCRALADHLRDRAAGRPTTAPEVTAVRQVREELATSSARPLTPTARQTALSSLLDALGRATLILQHLPPDADLDAGATETAPLAIVGADAYEAAARAITDGAPVDITPVHDALVAQRRTMVAALTDGDGAHRRAIEDSAGTTMRIRFASSLGAISAATAATWMGERPGGVVHLDVEVDLPEHGASAFWRRARHTLAFHFRWQSTRFRNSLRAAVALTASLVLARVVDFDHAFWVVLGTLMVLRSGVNDTTTTALQALRGTLIGFAIAAPAAYFADGDDTLLWVLLPLVTFLAAWAPGAVGLGSGQAAFTLFVVVLFNLAAPSGSQTAVIRLETVATGIAVAVVAGFVFWPRGPQASLGPIAARLYRASGASIRAVSAEALGLSGGDGAQRVARHELLAAKEQLEETLQELASDHRSDVALTNRVAIMTPPSLVRAGDWSRVDLALGTIGADEGVPDVAPPGLEAEAFEVASRFDAVAVDLADPDATRASLPPPAPADVTPGRPSTESVDPAQFLRLVWLWTWLGTVDHSLRATADETIATVRGLPRHWWR